MPAVESQFVHLVQRRLRAGALDMHPVERAKQAGSLLPDPTVNQRRHALRVAHHIQKLVDLLGRWRVLVIAGQTDKTHARRLAHPPLIRLPAVTVLPTPCAAQTDDRPQTVLLDEGGKLLGTWLAAAIEHPIMNGAKIPQSVKRRPEQPA